MLGDRHSPQRRLRDEREGAFAADDYSSQVELAGACGVGMKNVVEMVAAAIDPGFRLTLLDVRLLAVDQLRETANQVAAARIGITVWVIGDRMRADFHYV